MSRWALRQASRFSRSSERARFSASVKARWHRRGGSCAGCGHPPRSSASSSARRFFCARRSAAAVGASAAATKPYQRHRLPCLVTRRWPASVARSGARRRWSSNEADLVGAGAPRRPEPGDNWRAASRRGEVVGSSVAAAPSLPVQRGGVVAVLASRSSPSAAPRAVFVAGRDLELVDQRPATAAPALTACGRASVLRPGEPVERRFDLLQLRTRTRIGGGLRCDGGRCRRQLPRFRAVLASVCAAVERCALGGQRRVGAERAGAMAVGFAHHVGDLRRFRPHLARAPRQRCAQRPRRGGPQLRQGIGSGAGLALGFGDFALRRFGAARRGLERAAVRWRFGLERSRARQPTFQRVVAFADQCASRARRPVSIWRRRSLSSAGLRPRRASAPSSCSAWMTRPLQRRRQRQLPSRAAGPAPCRRGTPPSALRARCAARRPGRAPAWPGSASASFSLKRAAIQRHVEQRRLSLADITAQSAVAHCEARLLLQRFELLLDLQR